ncbi:aminotransferase class V-fold PLP-dependent enzyme [Nonomuraea indica]|uniref:aminotransferase class V-fold PLP-dependent enzyme n=1 Tax=Nonomuraea indica TaxID=1581193 RepID=UPI000C7970CD|nr:aminotransferase class V-fold PLP-dependent enzyme [Nonomuraea indica]
MRPEEFRALFPALRSTVWLDTPGAPPGPQPVVDTLRDALDAWSGGGFDWLEWDGAVAEARTLFARLIGVDPATVSAVGSLGEAAATVAASIPRCRVVVPAQEFRSNLFPWTAGHDVVAVPPRHGITRLEDLIDALDEDTGLLAVSEVTSREGQRLDLPALRAATDRVGARLFVNVTQSLGALSFDWAAVRPDYLAVHGYKWLLCPRGAAWLVTRPNLVGELRPLVPGWRSTGPPYGYFAGSLRLAADAGRCDASPAWLSWMGACAALRLMLSLDARLVERHCLALATQLIERAQDIGLRHPNDGGLSQIVVLQMDEADTAAARLRHGGIRATTLGDRVRFGFHYFNNQEDVDAVVRLLTG